MEWRVGVSPIPPLPNWYFPHLLISQEILTWIVPTLLTPVDLDLHTSRHTPVHACGDAGRGAWVGGGREYIPNPP